MAYSYVLLPGDGSNKIFSFSFPYLERSHIKVKVDGVPVVFSWLTSSSIQTTYAPNPGQVVEIRRVTPKDEPLVNFSDGSVLKEGDLDLITLFNLYCAQEAQDGVDASVAQDASGVYDGKGRRTTNFADPTDLTGLVTRNYFENVYKPELEDLIADADTAMDAQVAAATTQAASAASSASDAAVAETNAEAAQAAAEAARDDFFSRYLGDHAVAPTVRLDGSPLESGDLYFRTVTPKGIYVYSGGWVAAGSAVEGIVRTPASPVVATAGQTIVPVAGGYDPGLILVFVNGTKVDAPDINVTSGSEIVFTAPLADGEEVSWVAYGTFVVPNPSVVNVRTYITTPVDGATSNQDGIVAAVAAAFAAGAELEWPPGTYVSTANIPNFHSVLHKGVGKILRSGVTYAVSPKATENLNLYVSPTGSDTNDGLAASTPFATLQAACNVIQNKRDHLGRWRVFLAAGTYTEGCALYSIRQKDYRVRFIGPTVALNATPTAIIDGASAVGDYGFNLDSSGDVEIRDIKIINFNKNLESSAGVLAANTRLVRLHNVHVANCGIGYSMRSFSFYFTTGGVVENCRYGVLELFHVVRNYETISSLADGTKIRNCVYGLFAKEHCTGHLDWATIEDCQYGIYFSRSCTANASDCKIVRNSFGVNLRNGSFLVPNRIDWGTGTADRNTKPFIKDGTSNFVTNEGTTQSGGAIGQGEATLATYAPETPTTHTGTTAATTLTQLGELKPGCLVQPGTYVRAVVLGRKTGTAGTVLLELRQGGVAGASMTIPATATVFKAELWLISQGQDKQLAFATLTADVNAPAVTGRNLRTVAVESLGLSLSVRATLANAADAIIVDAAFAYSTEVLGTVEPSTP